MLGGDSGVRGDGDRSSGKRSRVDLEGAGHVDLADAVRQSYADRGPAPWNERVEPDWQVGQAERMGGNRGVPVDGPVRVPDDPADAGGFVGAGQIGHDLEGSGNAGGDARGGGDGPV